MKKILFFINTLNGGGAEKALVDMVNHLDPEKFQITVQTFLDTGVYKAALGEHIQYKSILKQKHPVIKRICSAVLTRILPPKILYNLFVKADYDYEIAYLEGFPTKIIASSTNQKSYKIGWLHTDLVHYPDSQMMFTKRFSEQKAYEKLDRVVCVSEGVRVKLIEKYHLPEEKTSVLYNVVDDEDICEKGRQDCGQNDRHPLVISVGRLTEPKAFDRLLRVHKRLIDDGVVHTLWIVGEGEKRQELEHYIQENNLQNVRLLGFQENPYMFMSKADLFVSSSIAEGYGIVMTEAVILGVPVISTNTAGVYEPPEAPRCSVVVNNEEELYAAMKLALMDSRELDRLKQDVNRKQGFFKKEYFIKQIEETLLSWN